MITGAFSSHRYRLMISVVITSFAVVSASPLISRGKTFVTSNGSGKILLNGSFMEYGTWATTLGLPSPPLHPKIILKNIQLGGRSFLTTLSDVVGDTFFGAGSYPHPPQGWQRDILRIPSQIPLKSPHSRSDSIV
jgi:hypothetical protein